MEPGELLRRKSERSHTRRRIWERDGRRCQYCSRPLHRASMSIDHELAKARGGPDTADNLVLSCPRCNSLKSDLSLEQFRERMKWQLSGMPYFSPDQVAYLKKWHGVEIAPADTRFWAERRRDGDPPMIRPNESYDYDGTRRKRKKNKNHGQV